MKKYLLKILVIIEIIFLIASSFYASYATTATQSAVKTSLEKMFKQNMRLTTNNGTSTSTITLEKGDTVSVDDSKVVTTTDGYTFNINYLVEDSKVKFSTTIDLTTAEVSDTELGILLIFLSKTAKTFLEECFLSVADAVGTNLDLAATYYGQKTSSDSGNITDPIFTYSSSSGGALMSNYQLEVDSEALSNLSESQVEVTPRTTVSFPTDAQLEAEDSGNAEEDRPGSSGSGSGSDAGSGTGSTGGTTSGSGTGTGSGTENAVPTNNTNTNSNNTNTASNTNTNTGRDLSKIKNTLPKTGSNFVAKDVCLAIIFISTTILVFVLMYNKKLGMTDEKK